MKSIVKQQKNTRARQMRVAQSNVKAAPVAISQVWENTEPVSLPGKRGGVRFAHREFVGDFSGGADFSVYSLSVNPGLNALFPWLSFISMVYETYLFHKLRFVMVPLQPTSQTGQNFMALDYDAADAAPSSKFELLNMKGARAAATWLGLNLSVSGRDEEALGRRRYLRYGALTSNLDVKTYDIGTIHVASQGLGSTVPAFSLFVDYDVELMTPQYSLTTLATALSARIVHGSSVSNTAVYGTSPTVTGGLDVEASGNTLTFNRPGMYQVSSIITGTGLNTSSGPALTGTATSTAKVWTGNAGSDAGTASSFEYIVEVLEAGQTVIGAFDTVSSAITAITSRIGPYLYSLG
jgi:hypothetical protein